MSFDTGGVDRVDFRFIKPAYGVIAMPNGTVRSFMGKGWQWPHLEAKQVAGKPSGFFGVFATEFIPAGLIVPYTGDTYSAADAKLLDTNDPNASKYSFELPYETIDANPAKPGCLMKYCIAGYVNEATHGTRELYNCKFVTLKGSSTAGAVHYPHHTRQGIYLLTMVDINAGEQLLAWYTASYEPNRMAFHYSAKTESAANVANVEQWANTEEGLRQYGWQPIRNE